MRLGGRDPLAPIGDDIGLGGDRLYGEQAEPGCGAADADGWVRARVEIESADQALTDFLRLGADIEILEPAGLREQAARTIQAMAAMYAPAAAERNQ